MLKEHNDISIVTLGDVCEIVSGSTPKSSVPEYWDGAIKWITPAELNEHTSVIYDSARHITEAGVRAAHLRSFPKGTVILSTRAPIGKTAIAGCEMYCNQGFKNLVCGDKIDNEYLYYYLSGHTEYLNTLGRGATFKELSKKTVENIRIPLPPIAVQRERACLFKSLDSLLLLKKSVCDAFDELVKSRFVEMFGNIDSNEKDFPVSNLGSLLLIERGGSPRPISQFVTDDPDGVNWIKIGDTEEGSIYITHTAEKIKRSGIKKSRHVVPGDFLLSNSMSFGRPYILKIDGYIHDGWLVLRDSKGIFDKMFLHTLLSSDYATREFSKKAAGTTVKNLNKDIVSSVRVPVPPIDIQQEFASFVTQVDKSKSAVQSAIEQLETLKASLMQEYFSL